MASSSLSRLEKIVLQDRDSITFEIDELVAKQSVTIKHMIEDILANRGPILLSKIPSNILVKVIDYCKCIFTQPPTDVLDMIKRKDPEHICKIFNITLDFSP
ncbi:hypothetical protein M9H77_01689 [Catharanthus roseus]|uniref:Uncharacterized protein n=1 Tax=Catharanthus roseus TaxID=4058 RepID=A0ACC0C6G9_CATRO|nr:hypothetical protein M9H77_01689 [Catharanthus roseus]